MKLLIAGLFIMAAMFWAIDSLFTIQKHPLNDSKGNDDSERDLDSSVHKIDLLRDEELKAIHAKAKSISHSKGHIVNVEGKTPEYRRSLIRKVEIKTKSYSLTKVLRLLHNSTQEKKLALLQALELLVHEYETAIDFANNGGIESIIPLVEDADDKIASAAISVFSAAMQGNPVVQKKVASSKLYDVLDILLTKLVSKSEYFSNTLYAISSYLRNMPDSQQKFLENGGIFQLADIILNNSTALKLKLHSITILADLAYEVFEDAYMSYENAELLKVFVEDVQATDVCQKITEFLDFDESNLNKETFYSEYLIHDKTIYAMRALEKVCAHEFEKGHVKDAVEKLMLKYDPYVELTWYSEIDKDLKVSIHKELTTFYERMYLKRDLKRLEL